MGNSILTILISRDLVYHIAKFHPFVTFSFGLFLIFINMHILKIAHQYSCRPHVKERNCSQPEQGYFAGHLDFKIYEAESARTPVVDFIIANFNQLI